MSTPPSFSQVTVTTNSKACQVLPIAALETHFKAKANSTRGTDSPTLSMCTVSIPDKLHEVALTIKRTEGIALTVDQRLAMFQDQGIYSQVKKLGSVACTLMSPNMSPKGSDLQVATCFLDDGKGGYLALALSSTDPKQVSFESIKELLEKASSARK